MTTVTKHSTPVYGSQAPSSCSLSPTTRIASTRGYLRSAVYLGNMLHKLISHGERKYKNCLSSRDERHGNGYPARIRMNTDGDTPVQGKDTA